MTKVEELQEKLTESLTYEFNGMLRGVLADFPALIAAVKEEERERIVRGSQRFLQGAYVVDSPHIDIFYDRAGMGTTLTTCELFIIPASVLAPKKKP